MAQTSSSDVEPARDHAAGEQHGATTPSRWGARLRTFVGALLVIALTAVAGYVAGRVHAWNAVREAQARLQMALEEHRHAFDNASNKHRGELAQLRAEIDAERRAQARFAQLASLQEGLRQGYRSQRALDARNFGIAHEALQQARTALGPLAASVNALPSVVERIERLDVQVAGNLSVQRQELYEILDALDSIVAREAEGAVEGAEWRAHWLPEPTYAMHARRASRCVSKVIRA